jgi:hypothetical protein
MPEMTTFGSNKYSLEHLSNLLFFLLRFDFRGEALQLITWLLSVDGVIALASTSESATSDTRRCVPCTPAE